MAPLPVTALGRWSLTTSPLPARSQISAVHVYDFDNTLFKSPLPNPRIWVGQAVGTLMSADEISGGGWWHDRAILAATGGGAGVEAARAWEGWWNETVVELARLSIAAPDVLTILMTGRSESGFGELITQMVASQQLAFDMVVLQPRVGPQGEVFANTLEFKQTVLRRVLDAYHVGQLRIYEDRPHHVRAFREFLAESGVSGDVVHVQTKPCFLDPVVEIAQVDAMLARHVGSPLAIAKNTLFTSYQLAAADARRLLGLLKPRLESDVKVHGTNIVISARTLTPAQLLKLGGLGAHVRWRVVGLGNWNNRVWAARIQPVDPSTHVHTEGKVPFVVLASRKGARPADAANITNWAPVEGFEFDSEICEKTVLRIESPNTAGKANKATRRQKHRGPRR